MKVLHSTWIPETTDTFIQRGGFFIWIETDQPGGSSKKKKYHPHHLGQQQLADLLSHELGIQSSGYQNSLSEKISDQSVWLPTVDGKPLPSPALVVEEDLASEQTVSLASWRVDCYRLDAPLKAISDLHFLSFYQTDDLQLSNDFLFWYTFSQSLKPFILKDQYLPALLYREQKTRSKLKKYALYPKWQIVSDRYEILIQQAVEQMPQACANGYDKDSLLRHCSEVVINDALMKIGLQLPMAFLKRVQDSPVEGFLTAVNSDRPWQETTDLAVIQQWTQWRQKLISAEAHHGFCLCFQLQAASAEDPGGWSLEFQVTSRQDPSFKLGLADYWSKNASAKAALKPQLGDHFEETLLLSLGAAARMVPKLWQGLETDQPTAVALSLGEAFAFLKESAWLLEDAGFKVIVPAWWSPKGRRRAKIRLGTSNPTPSSGAGTGQSAVNLDHLLDYHYELAIGDQTVNESEWAQLIQAKTPLIHFRGQWIELDRDKMQQMLDFWQQHGDETPQIAVSDLIKKLAEDDETFEVAQKDALADMLICLKDESRLEPVETPHGLNAELREYQKRGLAWLRFLEKSGLQGCLADDMGLGKTMQVIANLVMEVEQEPAVPPTLLVAPTSVIGNWQKEIEKFAPQLKTGVHHGAAREKSAMAFEKRCRTQNMVITSYPLLRRDLTLFTGIEWQRVVLDEAQNIKNPKSAQSKAVLKLNGRYRLALTGTPVENRLMDLWSIFNFLNPGYLGNKTRFRKSYELPIQRDNDPSRSATLKRLVQPFILRRLKTDKTIIKDLPDKIENKQYCNLSQEQASLYGAVVQDVAQQLEDSEGIARQGLMLSTLMKLKQICNHPMQFLQDDSEFSPERSPKLERLGEMLEEGLAEGDSALVFTQFTEIGEKLDRYLKRQRHWNTYYLHGGVNRLKREAMMTEFQAPDTGPSVFILSLKAGGVGITLTKANHVFHFDRWWNPAVEDQATDRAFRIGQQKKVFVHKFVTLGTLEERIDQMIEDKKQIAESIVGNDESWLAHLDNEAFKDLIALNQQTVLE